MATDQARTGEIAVNPHGYLTTGNLFVDRRAKRLIDELVEQRFREEVNGWAAANTGRLRTRVAIRFEIAREFETLCAALGSWAFVSADEIFPDAE